MQSEQLRENHEQSKTKHKRHMQRAKDRITQVRVLQKPVSVSVGAVCGCVSACASSHKLLDLQQVLAIAVELCCCKHW